jgi:hypothetical protein
MEFQVRAKYTVKRINRNGKIYGSAHGTEGLGSTFCGLSVASPRWIFTSDCFTGTVTCKKCLRRMGLESPVKEREDPVEFVFEGKVQGYEVEDCGQSLIKWLTCKNSNILFVRLQSWDEDNDWFWKHGTELGAKNGYIKSHHKDFHKLIGKKVKMVLTVEE